MTHSYSNIPAYSKTAQGIGLPTSEYAHLKAIMERATRTDYTSLRQKSQNERAELATAQRSHSSLRKNPYFREYRDDLIRQILKGSPNFGSLKFTITKRGI